MHSTDVAEHRSLNRTSGKGATPVDPSEDFDDIYYLEQNPDVAFAINKGYIQSAYVHWLEYGRSEGRKWRRRRPVLSDCIKEITAACNGKPVWFSGAEYLSLNSDLGTGQDLDFALSHWQLYGRLEVLHGAVRPLNSVHANFSRLRNSIKDHIVTLLRDNAAHDTKLAQSRFAASFSSLLEENFDYLKRRAEHPRGLVFDEQVNQGPVNVLAIHAKACPAAAIVIEPLLELQRRKLVVVTSRCELDVTEQDVLNANVVVGFRTLLERTAQIASLAKALGRQFVYILDEDIWSMPIEYPRSRFHLAKPTLMTAARLALMADTVIVMTRELHGRLSGSGINAQMITALPQFTRIEAAKAAAAPPSANKPVTIGFSGSSDHAAELVMMRPVFETLLNSLGGQIRIDVIFPEAELPYRLDGVNYLPYQNDLDAYYRLRANRHWDIALAPVIENDFNNAKVPGRILENGAFATATVFSSVKLYSEIAPRVTGLLAKNTTEAWLSEIIFALESYGTRQQMGKNLYDYVQHNYSAAEAVKSWASLLKMDG